MKPEKENSTPMIAHIPDERPHVLPTVIGLAGCALLFAGAFWFGSSAAERANIAAHLHVQTAAVYQAFGNVSLIARSAYVFDAKTGRALFAKNPDAQLPLASLTKPILALVAEQTLAPNTVVTITPEALAQDGDVGLRAGEQWNLRDLVDATLIASSNDGAEAIALAMGGSGKAALTAMNNEAQTLGMTHTYFLNPTGLDESPTMSGSYGSASDYAKLLTYIIAHNADLIDATAKHSASFTSKSGVAHTFANTDEALGHIPGIIGGKTGYTDLAGGNLAVAFDADIGHPIIVVVLGSTEQGRFNDVSALVQAARESVAKQNASN